MMNTEQLATTILKMDEGWRSVPYYCTEGYPTVGYGFKIGGKNAPLPQFTLNRKVGELWLETEIDILVHQVQGLYPDLSPIRQAVLVSMAYQLGFDGLLKFKQMHKALFNKDYDKAAAEILDSKAAKKDTPARFARNALMMKNNELLGFYNA